jgi:hypothetical protein
MSDFLSSLAARALNAAATVRPRLASRFEPTPFARPLASEGPFEMEAEHPAIAAPPVTIPRTPLADTLGRTPAASRHELVSPPPDTPEPRRLSAPEPAPSSSLGAPPALPVAAVALPPRPGTTAPPSATVSRLVPAGSEPDAAPRRSGASLPAPISEPTPTRRPALLSGLREQAAPPPLPPERTPHRGSDSPPPPQRPALARVSAASLQPAVVRREEVRETSPVIQVTIGRIEVRAVVSTSPPPPAPVPRRPTTSLEDYLRTRDREGR